MATIAWALARAATGCGISECVECCSAVATRHAASSLQNAVVVQLKSVEFKVLRFCISAAPAALLARVRLMLPASSVLGLVEAQVLHHVAIGQSSFPACFEVSERSCEAPLRLQVLHHVAIGQSSFPACFEVSERSCEAPLRLLAASTRGDRPILVE